MIWPFLTSTANSTSFDSNFGNCRITLQAHAFEDKEGKERYNIQLTFPVEIQSEKLIENLEATNSNAELLLAGLK